MAVSMMALTAIAMVVKPAGDPSGFSNGCGGSEFSVKGDVEELRKEKKKEGQAT